MAADPNTQLKEAYTIFPMPNASEFWAAHRKGKLGDIKPTLFSPGVVFRTKYKMKSAYQYLKVGVSSYSEASVDMFDAFLASAKPPVAADTATEALNEKPAAAEKPKQESDIVKPAAPAEEGDADCAAPTIPASHAVVACPHCSGMITLTISASKTPVDEIISGAKQAVAAATAEAAPAVEPTTAVAPVTEKAPEQTASAPDVRVTYTAKPAKDLTKTQLGAIESLIRDGALAQKALTDRLSSAALVVFAEENNKIISCMALSGRDASYIRDTASKSETTIPSTALELTWIRTVKDLEKKDREAVLVGMYEALKTAKAASATLRDLKIFSVYNTDNVTGFETMGLLGMTKYGREYAGLKKRAQVFTVADV
jgi:hypothetical protein